MLIQSVSPAAASVAAYRAYAGAQAELLARMTRVLAKDIKDGDVQAAQNDYAATHRYLERIRALLRGDLADGLDVEAETAAGDKDDARLAVFRRIEHALFALRSTRDLSPEADELYGETLRLQARVATQPIAFVVLTEAPGSLIDAVTSRVRDGGRAPYARTDLWDIEANVDGAEAIIAVLQQQIAARDPRLTSRISAAFAKTRERLATFRDGCGFKTYDLLTLADRSGLAATTAALARELAMLKTIAVID